MAQVPDKVLAWLYSVLHEYHDAQRTYSDTARVLSTYPTLSPRTEVYTYENGNSSLLLTLSGTLPVTFRGTIYRFPLKIWMPRAYPKESPTGYVTPGRDMVIRAGQHVGVDGRIYHPYLRDWSKMWDRANLAEFLEFLQQVFAKEPPVISGTQQPPKLPPKQTFESPSPAGQPNSDVPPPRPPKEGEQPAEDWPQRTSSRNLATDGPPLPPIPLELSQRQQHPQTQPFQTAYAAELPSRSKSQPQGPTAPQLPRYENGRPAGPPLPPIPDQIRPQQQPYQQQRSNYERSPVSPVSPMNGYSELPERKYSYPPPSMQPARLQKPPNQQQPPTPRTLHPQQQAQYLPSPQPGAPAQTYPHSQTYPPPPQQQQQQPKPQPPQPPPDLLSDPFEVALPSPSASGPPLPAPPIPPNPEKEHLLHALSASLVHQAQQTVHQNLSALAPLQAQQNALRAAHERLESEIRQLEQLDQTIAANEAILHRSIQECDRTISSAKSKPPPPIDDVLIPTTMVANQLWTLCAEEAACREAMYVLQKAVDRGRVNGNDFVRQMRALGRECFLKMVLARKCARGLGLEVDGK